MAALADAEARKLADQRIAAAVHRLGHHDAAELVDVRRAAQQNARLVRLAGGGA